MGLLVAFSMIGCNDWFEVSPETQISSDDLYKSVRREPVREGVDVGAGGRVGTILRQAEYGSGLPERERPLV